MTGWVCLPLGQELGTARSRSSRYHVGGWWWGQQSPFSLQGPARGHAWVLIPGDRKMLLQGDLQRGERFAFGSQHPGMEEPCLKVSPCALVHRFRHRGPLLSRSFLCSFCPSSSLPKNITDDGLTMTPALSCALYWVCLSRQRLFWEQRGDFQAV